MRRILTHTARPQRGSLSGAGFSPPQHQGRRQLGLFLKGIGLPLEQALAFWRQEFSPKCTGEAFDKQYAYNIRHSYGKEGKRADYTPLSCMTVRRGWERAVCVAHAYSSWHRPR